MRSLLLVFIGLFSALDVTAAVPATDRTVVLISLDGFPAWIWRDPALPVPNLRRLARDGAVAEAMTVSNPSVTWINHTTLITGVTPAKHGVLYNGLLVRQGPTQPPVIEPWVDKAELVRVPTLYDLAFKAGLKTAQVDWVAILNSGTINSEFLEIPKPGGALEREMVAKGLISVPEIAGFNKGKSAAWKDMVWTDAAIEIIKTQKPNLLLFHPLNTDSTNHTYGPGSSASLTAYAYADRLVGDLLQALDQAGLREKATIIVTTDHGFKKVDKHFYPNVALRKAGLLTVADKKVSSCDAYVVAQGGLGFAFVTDPTKRAALLPKLKEVCLGMAGVERVIEGSQAGELGMPTPEQNQGMGDLILYAKAGYAFQRNFEEDVEVVEAKGYLGTHGYLNTDPELDGIFIASGYGIKPGTHLGRISNLDVAPTLAQMLGLNLVGDGRVLSEILVP